MSKLLLPPGHIFSYSQISSYNQCPYSFYLKYILFPGRKEIENAYAQSGTLAHDIFENWAKGELTGPMMAEQWRDRFPKEVTVPFPPFPKGYGWKLLFNVGEYLERFDGFDDDWEIVATEKYYITEIEGSKFRGIVDLVLRDKKDGRLIVIDHKSKSLSAAKRDKEAINQLYAYSKFIYEAYGEYPKALYFHLFKENGVLIYEPFNKKRYDEVIDWIGDSIIDILMEEDWEAKYDKFFCQNLCGVRDVCETALGNL